MIAGPAASLPAAERDAPAPGKSGWGMRSAFAALLLLLVVEFGLPGVIMGLAYKLHGWPKASPPEIRALRIFFRPALNLAFVSDGYYEFYEKEFRLVVTSGNPYEDYLETKRTD